MGYCLLGTASKCLFDVAILAGLAPGRARMDLLVCGIAILNALKRRNIHSLQHRDVLLWNNLCLDQILPKHWRGRCAYYAHTISDQLLWYMMDLRRSLQGCFPITSWILYRQSGDHNRPSH